MDEIKNQDLNDFQLTDDEQERLFYNLNVIKNKNIEKFLKNSKEFFELRILQFIIYLLITFGIVAFFILLLMKIHLIIILIDIMVIIVYLFYVKYLEYKSIKKLKFIKKNLGTISNFGKKRKTLSINQIIFYSILMIATIIILIISMIGIDPLILIIVIAISLLFVYFDKENGYE